MFELRTAARWSGNGDAFDGGSLDQATLTDQPAIPLTPVALREELPRLLATSGRWIAERKPANHDSIGTRWLDVTIASMALLFFAPLMAFIAIAILLTNPGPIFFRQPRLGLGGRAFNCLKFRTMRQDAHSALADLLASDPLARAEWESTHKLRRDPRVSRLGNFLRKTSLDELPQFINVLVGDMSIVGPRPIVAEEAHRYRRHIRSYFAVRPGITGLWQISGRNHTTYRRRIACDVRYVRTRSTYRDVAIIALTVPVVLLGRGAY